MRRIRLTAKRQARGAAPGWFGRLRRCALGKRHDMAAIRKSIARARSHA